MIFCFIPAIMFHEVAHGLMAYKLGDPTAKSKGRLSLNPIKHVDPFGTVILPVLLLLAGGPIFGYAKPVPYNPNYFKNIRVGEVLTGLAGPGSNLIMGLIGAAVAFVITRFEPSAIMTIYYPTTIAGWTVFACYLFTMINFCLMMFNLLPIPPLDGSSIIAPFLSDKALKQYYSIQQYAMPVLMILLIAVPYVLHFSPISIYIDATAGNLTRLLFQV
jgi:Zn-dependent protease